MCNRNQTTSYVVYAGNPVPIPVEPVGWWVINGSLYCDKHFKTAADILKTFKLASIV